MFKASILYCRIDPRPHNQLGFTLVEILVTLLILSVGFLGMAAQQSVGLKSAQQSYFRSQAALLASDMTDRIRSNVAGLKAGNYVLDLGNTPSGAIDSCLATVCDSATLADTDIAEIYDGVSHRLPAGQLIISEPVIGVVRVVIMWDEERTAATGTDCDPSDKNDLACLSTFVEVGEIALL